MTTARLVKYDPMQQHMGTWLLGYDWNIYGCGTYWEPVSQVPAHARLKRFMERLDRKVHPPVSYFAAMERRYSGCGDSPIPIHWHFLAASRNSESMTAVAQKLWEDSFGNAKVEQYDRSLDGAFYTCKLANHPNGVITFNNLEKMKYDGPSDLIAVSRENPYVPAHLKDKVFGAYLALR